MNLPDCQHLLAGSLPCPEQCPRGTLLGQTAASDTHDGLRIRERREGILCQDDPVNALAAYWYGFGWLHGGIAMGLLDDGDGPGCPFTSVIEPFPGSEGET